MIVIGALTIKLNFYTIIWSYDENKKRYFRGKINVPEKFLKKMGNIEFYGKIFNTPSPLDEYLTYQYGDWKTRKNIR